MRKGFKSQNQTQNQIIEIVKTPSLFIGQPRYVQKYRMM
jgi:hypothetical protein